jgi:hypothetical protein
MVKFPWHKSTGTVYAVYVLIESVFGKLQFGYLNFIFNIPSLTM